MELHCAAFRTALGIIMTTRAENKYLLHEIEQERLEIKLVPELEKEELGLMYKSKGFEGELLKDIINKITQNEELWIREMVQEELGYSEIIEDVSYKTGVYLFFFFIFGSFFVLAPYLFLYKSQYSPTELFSFSIIGSIIGLFIIGVYWKNITGGHWFKSALNSISIGLIAFGASVLVGKFFAI